MGGLIIMSRLPTLKEWQQLVVKWRDTTDMDGKAMKVNNHIDWYNYMFGSSSNCKAKGKLKVPEGKRFVPKLKYVHRTVVKELGYNIKTGMIDD